MDGFFSILQTLWKETLPKALFAAVIPAAQFIWKRYRERNPEQKTRVLRDEVVNLQNFLRSLADAEDSPELEASRRAAQRELEVRMVALASLSSIASHTSASTPGRLDIAVPPVAPASVVRAPTGTPGVLQRLFLLHAPSRGITWIPQTLFFVSLLASLMVAFAVVALSKELDDRETLGALIASLLFWSVLTVLFRTWAVALEGKHAAAKPQWPTGLRGALLLYIPPQHRVLLLHVLFYFGVVLFVYGVWYYFISGEEVVESVGSDGQRVDASLFLVVPLSYIALATLAVRDWAVSFHPDGNAARQRLAWFFPGRPARFLGWIADALYYGAALLVPLVLFQTFFDDESGRLSLTLPFRSSQYHLWIFSPVILMCVSARGWARRFETPHPRVQHVTTGLRGSMRKVLLLDRPRDQEEWMAFTIFWIATLLLVLGARQGGDIRLFRMIVASLILVPAVGWLASLSR